MRSVECDSFPFSAVTLVAGRQEGRWAGKKLGVGFVAGKRGPLGFQMILECQRALTGMLSFVMAMENGTWLTPRNTLIHHICYHAKFRYSVSNRLGVTKIWGTLVCV